MAASTARGAAFEAAPVNVTGGEPIGAGEAHWSISRALSRPARGCGSSRDRVGRRATIRQRAFSRRSCIDSEHAEEREVKVDVEARADVRARLESPGAAAIARREKSRQWPRVACSCLEWLGLSLMALGRSARRSPRGRAAARRVATGRHRSDASNLGVPFAFVNSKREPQSRRYMKSREGELAVRDQVASGYPRVLALTAPRRELSLTPVHIRRKTPARIIRGNSKHRPQGHEAGRPCPRLKRWPSVSRGVGRAACSRSPLAAEWASCDRSGGPIRRRRRRRSGCCRRDRRCDFLLRRRSIVREVLAHRGDAVQSTPSATLMYRSVLVTFARH